MEGERIRWGGEGKGWEGRGGEQGRGRSSPNVRDALTPLVLRYRDYNVTVKLKCKAR